jgi:uncharacterized protein YjeT (DUF2065 family)
MAFFKHYTGSSNLRLRRLEQAVWVLIYGGLLSVVWAYFVQQDLPENAAILYTVGGCAVAAGIVLIYLRSRLHEEPPGEV